MDTGRSLRRFAIAALLLALAVPVLASATISTRRAIDTKPVRMQFDPKLGVHIVHSHTGVYYFERSYIRLHAGRWEFSKTASGPWLKRPHEWVPMGLRIKHYAEEL